MESALHEHDADAVKHTEEQPRLVAWYCGHWEVRNVLVFEDVRILQEVSQVG